jgi:hypothetical protein
MARGDPIEGTVLVLVTAQAAVGERVPDLIDAVQARLGPRLAEYRRRYEVVHETEDAVVCLAESGHLDEVCADLDLDDREADAVRRAHQEQARRVAREADAEAAMETALEIRDPVVIGRGEG